jgi:tetratricopeptide (TPR) repeat protein
MDRTNATERSAPRNRRARILPAAALLLLALASASTPAARAATVDEQVMAGIEQLYNVQFDAAAKSFDRAIAVDPSDPRGYFYRANVHLWAYVFDSRPEQLARYMSASERGIKAAEARLKINPRDNVAKLFLGMTYGFRAISNARAENIMAAALSAKACYDRLSEVVRADPKLYDAYLGLGIFHYVFGTIPEAGQVVVGLGGIKGDAALGIREIEAAAARGRYFRNDAQLIVALLNIYHRDDLTTGLRGLEAMAKRYPKNVAILYAIGSAYLDQHLPEQAVPYFERVAKQANNDFRAITTMSVGRTGMAYFQRNDFVRARGYLQQFLRSGDDKLLRAHAWYLLGVCNEMQGDRALALKAYERATKSSGVSSPEDRAAQRRARERMKTPMSEVDRQLLRATNAAGSNGYVEAEKLARGVLATRGISVSQRAIANYALAQALQGRGLCREAIDAYTAAVRSGNHSESWVTPWSHYQMGLCWGKLGNAAKQQESLRQAGTYKGYDNEVQLRFKLQRDVTKID